MFKLKESEFLNKSYIWFGIAGCAIPVINLLCILFFRMGFFRMEFNIFFFIILPNFIAKILMIVWALRYASTRMFGKDINDFAKSLIWLGIVNMIVVAVDESTKFYYLAQAFTAVIYTIFMCTIVYQRRHAVRAKKYATIGFAVNMILYLTLAVEVFIVFISLMDGYDPYQITLIGVFYLLMIAGIIGVGIIEKKYRIVMREAVRENEKK